MKIITIGALKGGVGKTNFCFNLGAFLANKKNNKVLLIDLDPQANLSQNLGIGVETSFSSDLFLKSLSDADLTNLIVNTKIERLDLIPTDIDQSKLEFDLFNEISREKKLTKFFSKHHDFLKKYDYIILDTNPSLNLTNINAFLSADSVVLMCDNSIHSLRSLNLIYNLWNNMSGQLEKHNNIKAVIFNNFDHFKISKDFKEIVNNSDLSQLVINQEIRKKTLFKKSEILGTPVYALLKDSENPYFNIVDELIERGVL